MPFSFYFNPFFLEFEISFSSVSHLKFVLPLVFLFFSYVDGTIIDFR